jgi:hypothetical protein
MIIEDMMIVNIHQTVAIHINGNTLVSINSFYF